MKIPVYIGCGVVLFTVEASAVYMFLGLTTLVFNIYIYNIKAYLICL